MYKVESGIAVEGLKRKTRVYPFSSMKVGDSFAAHYSEMLNIRSAASRYGSRHRQSFTTKTVDAETVRCWRIA